VAGVWFLSFTPALLAVAAVATVRGGAACRDYWLAWCGLAATMAGDYFLAVKGAPLHSDGFLCGVAGFAWAQGCWLAFLRRHAAWNPRVAVGLLFGLGVLFAARVAPALPSARLAWALGGYALLSVASVSYACGAHSLSSAWRYGLCALLFSDVMIVFGQILRVPYAGRLVGVTYLAGLALIAAAIARCGRCPRPSVRIRQLRRAPHAVFWGGAAVLLLFLAAMFLCPGQGYNPCMRMLSVLGRTRLQGVEYPACHYLFTVGLAVSAFAAARFFPALACFAEGARGKACVRWGGAFNAAGLFVVACVPENVHGPLHNVGCFAAVGGGGAALLALTLRGAGSRVPATVRWGWLAWCGLLVAAFEAFLVCHRARLLPFAPYVPTCQKLLILTFASWLGYYAALLRRLTRRAPGRAHFSPGGEKNLWCIGR
jgi:hypothetical protein